MSVFKQVLAETDNPSQLPKPALEKLNDIVRLADGFMARARTAGEERRDAKRRVDGLKVEQSRVLSDLVGRRPGGVVEEMAAAISKAEADALRIAAGAEAASEDANTYGAVRRTLMDWLEEHKKATFASIVPRAAPKVKPGDSAMQMVARIRLKIDEVKAERSAVADAPIPIADAKAAMRAHVSALAASGEPDALPLLDGGRLAWSTETMTDGAGRALKYGVPNAFALTVWLNHDAIVARLDAQLDAEPEQEGALTAEQRKTETARLTAELLDLEREEEAIIAAAATVMTIIPRRGDADPRAVLELAENVPGLEN